jgi:hypothetical protein
MRPRAEDVGLAGVRDGQAHPRLEGEEILHVDGPHHGRQRPGGGRDPGQAAHDPEQAQPGGHEGEVHEAGEQHEDAADEQHAAPVLLVRQQREQEQQHEEGAGIEGIHAGDEHGQHRQRQGGGLQFADEGEMQGRFHGLPGPAPDGQVRIGPAGFQAAQQFRGAHVAAPAHPHPAAEQESRHRLGLLPQVRGHGHVAFDIFPMARQFQGMQDDPGMCPRQLFHLGTGLQAMGAAHGPEEVEMDPGRAFGARCGPGIGCGRGRGGQENQQGKQDRQPTWRKQSQNAIEHGCRILKRYPEAPSLSARRASNGRNQD